MVLGKVKSFTVSYDCLNDSNVPVFSSGDCVSGRVIIEVTGEIRVKSLKIHAKGFAKVRWTESRNAGSNTAYTQNYTEEVEYLNHRDILIGHERDAYVEHFKQVRYTCVWNIVLLVFQTMTILRRDLPLSIQEDMSMHSALSFHRHLWLPLSKGSMAAYVIG